MPCGTQVIATAPLGALADELIPSDYCVEDNNFLLDYFRLSADKRLIYGGGVVYGARDPKEVKSLIRPQMVKTFPQLQDVEIDFGWTGNFLLTLSRLPQVGTLAPNIYYSQGCSGHGITFTHLIGRVLGEAHAGRRHPFRCLRASAAPPVPGRAPAARAVHGHGRACGTRCATSWVSEPHRRDRHERQGIRHRRARRDRLHRPPGHRIPAAALPGRQRRALGHGRAQRRQAGAGARRTRRRRPTRRWSSPTAPTRPACRP